MMRPPVWLTTCILMSLYVMVRTDNVRVVDDEDDFDYDYDYEEDQPLKKPVPEPKNPLRTNRNFVRDKEHLKEHMDDVDDWGDEEHEVQSAEFLFFDTHDFDNNDLLDGLELYHAIEHTMADQMIKIQNEKAKKNVIDRKIKRLYIQVEGTIDLMLRQEDANKDGYLSYAEFAASRMSSQLASKSGL